MVLRIDNVFFNTPDVLALATSYSKLTGLPVRRSQVEAPGLMWAEIGVGGMELSFRKADSTPKIHPHLNGQFRETPPGAGATISFEVEDTDAARKRAEEIGAKMHGDPIICSGGQEIISVFSDPGGRVVQFYEPRFAEAFAESAAARGSPSLAMSTRAVQVGSNVRGISGLAYSVTFADDDIKASTAFYSDLLQLAPGVEEEGRVGFDLDGAFIEIVSSARQRSELSEDPSQVKGVIPLLEVVSLARTAELLSRSKVEVRAVESAVVGTRATLRDPDGNFVQIWERPVHL